MISNTTTEASELPLEALDSIFDGSNVNLNTINLLLGSVGVNFTVTSLEDVSNEQLWKVITFLLYRQAMPNLSLPPTISSDN